MLFDVRVISWFVKVESGEDFTDLIRIHTHINFIRDCSTAMHNVHADSLSFFRGLGFGHAEMNMTVTGFMG